MNVAPLPERLGLALVGSRGTGKSTVGRLLAARLGRTFVDADAALEARLGRSIASIFEEHGEPFFRDREESVLEELTAEPGLVLATGGGVVLREKNRRALQRYGYVVWLRADAAALAARLQANPAALAGRPALTAAGTIGEIAAVQAAREPLYRDVAHVVIDTDGLRPDEVAAAVLSSLPVRPSG